jgi:hypothetical protein
VSASAAVTELSPANHELIDVGFDFGAFDDCEGEPELRVSVSSDEPSSSASGAGGENGPDAVVLRGAGGRPEAVLLRAERSSSGNGRVYRISVEATDPCGHSAAASVDVSVPPNGNSPAVDDGQYYDATASN